MFPVETISAKMLDYYVDRRDTLIIDLREKESYMHSHVKGAVNMPYGEIDGYTAGASTLARNKNYYKPQKCGLFYVKFYLFLCCTELYFIFICDIMRYETQL